MVSKIGIMIKKTALVLAVSTMVLCFISVGLAEAARAPDFILKDLQGETFRLRDQQGKPVLLIFSTTWCPSCLAQLPWWKELHHKYHRQGLVVVNVNIMETKEKMARFASRHQLPFRSVLDTQGDVANIYGIRGVPTLVLLDREGRIVCRPCVVIEGHLEKMLARK